MLSYVTVGLVLLHRSRVINFNQINKDLCVGFWLVFILQTRVVFDVMNVLSATSRCGNESFITKILRDVNSH